MKVRLWWRSIISSVGSHVWVTRLTKFGKCSAALEGEGWLGREADGRRKAVMKAFKRRLISSPFSLTLAKSDPLPCHALIQPPSPPETSPTLPLPQPEGCRMKAMMRCLGTLLEVSDGEGESATG